MNRLASVLLISLVACSTADSADDLGDSNDPISITENTPEAKGILRVANELTFTQLDIDVALPSNAAKNIVNHRTYDTIAKLDAVPYVGPSAFAKLLAYAQAHGYIETPNRVATCTGTTYPGPVTCGDEHWAFDRPTPSGQRLSAAVTFGVKDVWAAGAGGTVMHFDGVDWKPEQTPVCELITSLWGTSATNLWAVGEAGRILHRTASGWTVIDSGGCDYLYAVWGSATGSIWIAGQNGVLRGDATHAFTLATTDATIRPRALYGFSDSDVWGVDSGEIFHWDGTAWTTTTTGHFDFESLWGADRDHMVIGGFAWDSNAIAAWNFSAATVATPTMKVLTGNRTPAVGGTSATDMWLVADNGNTWRYDGATWTFVTTGTHDELNGLAMLSPSEGWAVGESGQRLHWNGANWTDIVGAQHGFSAVFAVSSSDAWASSYNTLWHWDGSAWSIAPVNGFFNGVWASGANDVWAVGLDVRHYDGHTWSTVAMPVAAGFTSGGWFTVGGSGPNDIWIGGANSNYTGKLVHWNGTTWTSVSYGVSGEVRGIYAPSASEAWLATDSGLVHWDGTLWSIAGPLNTGKLDRIIGVGAHDLWATGRNVYHFDGNTWTQALTGTSSYTEYQAAWGSSASDVWVAGSGVFGGASTLAHWDGAQWTTHVNPSSNIITGIAKTSAGVIAVDTGGAMLRLR